jgi:hypothetical protein
MGLKPVEPQILSDFITWEKREPDVMAGESPLESAGIMKPGYL